MAKGIRWLILFLASGTIVFAAPSAALSLSRDGVLRWSSPFLSTTVSIDRSLSLESKIWLPWQSFRTANSSGGLNLELTNAPAFYRMVLADPSSSIPGMNFIPAGHFQMGDNYGEGLAQELPVHIAYVSAFYIDQFEVTNRKLRDAFQWALTNNLIYTSDHRVIKLSAPPNLPLLDLHRDDYSESSTRYWSGVTLTNDVFGLVPGREDQPCIDTSWYGAAAYCNFRSQMEGLQPCFNLTDFTCDFTKNGYRLPTEAEWEKAARGGVTGHHYPWSSLGGSYRDFISTNFANYTPPTLPHPFNMKPVGYYNGGQNPSGPDMANGYGLYDMAGNAREWCYDWYDPGWYARSEAILRDPIGPLTGDSRVTRGGSFDLGERDLRVAARTAQPPATPTAASWYNGFRCVRRP